MASNTSRTMIAALQVSLDGFIEGPHGEKDWADSWASAIELIPDVDTFVLGGRMYRTTGSTGNRSTPILSVSRHSRSECPRRVKSPTPGWRQDTPHRAVQDSRERLVARGADHPGCRGAPNPQGTTREEHICGRRGNPRRKPSERELDRRAPADCSPASPGQGPGALQRRQQAPLARSRPGEVHRVRQSHPDLPNCECCELRGSVGLGPGARRRRPMTTHLT